MRSDGESGLLTDRRLNGELEGCGARELRRTDRAKIAARKLMARSVGRVQEELDATMAHASMLTKPAYARCGQSKDRAGAMHQVVVQLALAQPPRNGVSTRVLARLLHHKRRAAPMQVKEIHEVDQQLPMFSEPRSGRGESPGGIHDICLATVKPTPDSVSALADQASSTVTSFEVT